MSLSATFRLALRSLCLRRLPLAAHALTRLALTRLALTRTVASLLVLTRLRAPGLVLARPFPIRWRCPGLLLLGVRSAGVFLRRRLFAAPMLQNPLDRLAVVRAIGRHAVMRRSGIGRSGWRLRRSRGGPVLAGSRLARAAVFASVAARGPGIVRVLATGRPGRFLRLALTSGAGAVAAGRILLRPGCDRLFIAARIAILRRVVLPTFLTFGPLRLAVAAGGFLTTLPPLGLGFRCRRLLPIGVGAGTSVTLRGSPAPRLPCIRGPVGRLSAAIAVGPWRLGVA